MRVKGSGTAWRGRALVTALVALALLPAVAAAQDEGQSEPCRAPALAFPQGPAAWEPGSTWTYRLAVENRNEAPVKEVDATVSVSAPLGWTVAPRPVHLQLREGDVQQVSLPVTAPQRGTGAASGEIEITVLFTCERSNTIARAQETATIPVELSAGDVPWFLVVGGLAAAGGASGIAWAVRTRNGAVGLVSEAADKAVVPGKSVQFPLRVVNRRRAPDAVALDVTNAPEGWETHLALPQLDMEGREERDLWVSLRAPRDARFGDEVTVTLTAQSRNAPQESATVQVTARVRREAQ